MLDCLLSMFKALGSGSEKYTLPNVIVCFQGSFGISAVISRPSLESVKMETLDSYISKIFLRIIFTMYISVCLHVCPGTMWMSGTHRIQKRALDPLELELQLVMSHLCGYWESNPGNSFFFF